MDYDNSTREAGRVSLVFLFPGYPQSQTVDGGHGPGEQGIPAPTHLQHPANTTINLHHNSYNQHLSGITEYLQSGVSC